MAYDYEMSKLFKYFRDDLKVSDAVAANLCIASAIDGIRAGLVDFDHQICRGLVEAFKQVDVNINASVETRE